MPTTIITQIENSKAVKNKPVKKEEKTFILYLKKSLAREKYILVIIFVDY